MRVAGSLCFVAWKLNMLNLIIRNSLYFSKAGFRRSVAAAAMFAYVSALSGCGESVTTAPKQSPGPKSTDEIGEFKPELGKETVDSKVKISNPVTGALEAYEPLKQQVAELGIDQAVQMFNALEGRYPKDHDEFMTRVIKANNIRLPALSSDKSYEYDVENHCLMVVRKQPAQ